MWKCVWQGKGKGTLWPVLALLLVRLHKAASPGAATVWGGGGLIASAPLGRAPSFPVGSEGQFVQCRVACPLGLYF